MSVIFVPAAMEQFASKCNALYTSPRKNKTEGSEWFIPYRKLRTHNLTCYAANLSLKSEYEIDSYDYTKCLPLLGPAFCKMNGIEMVLVNLINSDLNFCSYKDAGMDVICDSGGFQLVRGKVDFIDPLDVAKRYNKTCTIGMDLDIPDVQGMDKKQWRALPKIQKENYEVIKEHLHKGIDICLVGHGKTVDERQEWFDLVDRDNPKYVAVAGLQRELSKSITKEMQQAEAILHACHLFPNAEYFHILGTTSVGAAYVYSLISHLGLAKKIGADSASYALIGVTGCFEIPHAWTSLKLPREFPVEAPIPCNCPVCSTIQDFRLYGAYITKAHTLLNYQRYFDYIYKLTGEYLNGNIKESDFIMLTKSASILNSQHLRQIREYVEECKVKGFRPLKRPRKLFGTTSISSSRNYDRYMGVIQAYEKYYQKGFL